MFVFGIDVPLPELLLVASVVIFLLLVESIIVVSLLMKQMGKTKKLADLIGKLSETILAIKAAELKQLDKLKGK